MTRLQESRIVEISPSGLTRGVGLPTHSYSTLTSQGIFTFPLSPTLSPLAPHGEREANRRERFGCRTELV